MAETYAALGEAAKAGMSTPADKVAAVATAWRRLQAEELEWAASALEGKDYVLTGEGSGGVDGLAAALSEDRVFFCGLRVGTVFFRVLYVGSDVGVIKRNKAQLQKNAPFNAMPGATHDLEVVAEGIPVLRDRVAAALSS